MGYYKRAYRRNIRKKFIEIIEFVIDNNYFRYNNEFYVQIFGCAMGSKLSPIIAQYVMDYLLDECLKKLPYKLAFIKKFVDDLILALPEDSVDLTLNIFNNFDAHIKFTIERETNKTVPFLDTLVKREDGNIIKLDWYMKPNASGRYVHYKSNHSITIKINFIKQMKHRIHKIYHKDFINKNLKILKNLLLKNGYPKGLVSTIIFSTSEQIEQQQPRGAQLGEIKLGVLPYYDHLTDRITKVFREENIVIARKSIKNVGSLFTKLKDNIPTMLKSNVIYKLTCNTCQNCYIGQTSQWVKNRIALHKSDIRKRQDRCALTNHIMANQEHNIDMDNVEILATENNYDRRIFMEMVHINKSDNTINKKTDTNHLNIIYTYLLEYDNRDNYFDGPVDE